MRVLAVAGVLVTFLGLARAPWPPGTQAAAPSLRGVVDLTIGSVDENRDVYIFGSVNGLALLDDGRILVADHATHDVRVFGADGRHQYTIGRAGAGPGDLRLPCCLTIGSDGHLWIRDVGNRRYSIFSLGPSDAKFVRTVRSVMTNPRVLSDRVQWDMRGHIVDIGQLPGDVLHRAFLDTTGTPFRWDSLKPPPAESLAVMNVPRRQEGGFAVYYFYQPHGPEALRAHGPRGETAAAVSSNYAVSWFDAAQHRVTLITRDVAGPELSARERRAAHAELEDVVQETGKTRGSLPFDVPRRKPPLRALGFDLEGRLWVERSVPEGGPREADVYERNGRRVAVMTWPAHINLRHRVLRGRTAVGVAVDSLGTNTIVRLQFR